MKNLLTETLEVLREHGKQETEISWVGSIDGKRAISWAQFKTIAGDTIYNNGYGGQEIASDLVIVGPDWWLERQEYDGSEWWEFQTLPRLAQGHTGFARVNLQHCSWNSVQELNS